MLPLRVAVAGSVFTLVFPPLLLGTSLRSIYMKLAYGKPSRILKHGTLNNTNDEDMHYPCQVLLNQPLDEAKLKVALVGLCGKFSAPLRLRQLLVITFFSSEVLAITAEAQAGGIAEKNVSLEFVAEEPRDWPIPETADARGETGSFDIDYFIPAFRKSWNGEKGCTYLL